MKKEKVFPLISGFFYLVITLLYTYFFCSYEYDTDYFLFDISHGIIFGLICLGIAASLFTKNKKSAVFFLIFNLLFNLCTVAHYVFVYLGASAFEDFIYDIADRNETPYLISGFVSSVSYVILLITAAVYSKCKKAKGRIWVAAPIMLLLLPITCIIFELVLSETIENGRLHYCVYALEIIALSFAGLWFDAESENRLNKIKEAEKPKSSLAVEEPDNVDPEKLKLYKELLRSGIITREEYYQKLEENAQK